MSFTLGRGVLAGTCSTALLVGGSVVVASRASAGVAARVSASSGILASGQKLADGASITSPDGDYELIMQTDGNLVEYQSGKARFNTHTENEGGNTATMEADGDLVVEATSGQLRWSSQTEDNSAAHLAMQNDGNLVVYSSAAKPLWARSWRQTVSGAEAYAKVLFPRFGWTVSTQFPYLNDVWGDIESGWRWNVCSGGALFPDCDYTGSAYGITQSDPGNKMASSNPDWATDGMTQVAWGLTYISEVYGSPKAAYEHEENGCADAPCGYIVRS